MLALALLWRKKHSVLNQWLMVVALAFASELIINGLFISARFTLGFYVSRLFSIVTSTIVLVVLLEETTKLYGRLARSNAMLLREQNNRLMTLEALASSISHEVRQPLTGIVASVAHFCDFSEVHPPNWTRRAQPRKGSLLPVIAPVKYSTTFATYLEQLSSSKVR